MACGYALGISGTALSEAQNYIHINDFWVGLIGASSLLGLMGSAIIGRIADRIGRRKMLMIDMYVFSLFSLLRNAELFSRQIYRVSTEMERHLKALQISRRGQ